MVRELRAARCGWGRDTGRTMSQKNVDLARRAYAAFQAGDLDKWVSYFDGEVEFDSSEMEGPFHGHEGLREWAMGLRAAFSNWEPSIVEIRDLQDRVLIHGTATGAGARSGAGINVDFWQALEFRDGRIVWYAAFRNEKDALEGLGSRP